MNYRIGIQDRRPEKLVLHLWESSHQLSWYKLIISPPLFHCSMKYSHSRWIKDEFTMLKFYNCKLYVEWVIPQWYLTHSVSDSHQHYPIDQFISDSNSNISQCSIPLAHSYKPIYVRYIFSICKLMGTLFPLSENNYLCCKDLSFTEFYSPFWQDSNIHNSCVLWIIKAIFLWNCGLILIQRLAHSCFYH